MTVTLIPLAGLLAPLTIEGADATVYLNNLLSNDARQVSPTAAQWSSLNSPKGRMIANFPLWQQQDGRYCIAPAADLAEALLKKLRMYVLRSKVTLQPAAGLRLFALASAPAALAAALPTLPAETMHSAADPQGRTLLRLAEDLALLALPDGVPLPDFPTAPAEGTADDWHRALIRHQLPLITAATQEAFVAQMLGFEKIGVSFQKGCYPGQEIIARAQYLGKVKRHPVVLHLDTPAAVGSTLPDGAQVVTLAPAPEGGYTALAVAAPQAAEGA